jgi:hypothetical protein
MNNKDKFFELANIHASTDYADSSSIKTANQAADEMSGIIDSLESSIDVENLLPLLSHLKAGFWVAQLVADSRVATEAQKKLCIKTVQSIASGDDVNALGAEMWLSERGH